MKTQRYYHTACAFMGKYVIVSGSKMDRDFSSRKTELYDTDNDTWTDLPMMINGRY